MKRLFSILLCLVMCFGCSLTAFAEGALPAETELAANNTDNTVSPMAIPSGLMFGGVYTIKCKRSTGTPPLVLNVNDGDNNRSTVSMMKKDDSNKQKFRLISSDRLISTDDSSNSYASYFKLLAMCSSSGRVLDARRDSYNNLVSGSQAEIYDSDDDEAQQFMITGDNTSGYVIHLAPKQDQDPDLVLTAQTMDSGANVQFKINAGTNFQKWIFILDDSFSRSMQPDPDAQNKSNWCWAAAAKMVAEHNGGVNRNILRYAKELEDEVGVHKNFYGLNALAYLTVDGVQRAIVEEVHRDDMDRRATYDEVIRALEFASANSMKIEWIWDGRTTGLTANSINILNDDLIKGRYVVGYVEFSANAPAHYLVLKDYDGINLYTIFDPWNRNEFQATSTQLFGTHNSSEKLPYADEYYGKMLGFHHCY